MQCSISFPVKHHIDFGFGKHRGVQREREEDIGSVIYFRLFFFPCLTKDLHQCSRLLWRRGPGKTSGQSPSLSPGLTRNHLPKEVTCSEQQ